VFLLIRVTRVLQCVALCSLCVFSAYAQSSHLLAHVRQGAPLLSAEAKAEFNACSRKQTSERERLSLLTGYLHLSEGDAEAAVAQLTSVRAPKGLEPFHAWYLGEAQSWSGRRESALKTFQKIKAPGSPVWLLRKVELRVAEIQLALGQGHAALPVFEVAASGRRSPDLLYSRALARLSVKRVEDAMTDLRLIYLRFPTHPHAAAAETLLRDSSKFSFTVDEKLDRGEELLEGGDAGRALALLDAVEGALPQAYQARSDLLRARILLSQGHYDLAEKLLERVASGTTAYAPSAIMALAKRVGRSGDDVRARHLYESLTRRFPTDRSADEADYLAAWLAFQDGDASASAAKFEAWELHHPRSRRRDEARWFRARALLRIPKRTEARRVLASLVADFPGSSLVPQARYWMIRAAQLDADEHSRSAGIDAGESPTGALALVGTDGSASFDAGPTPSDLPDVESEYRNLALQYPGSFYARLAVERLIELEAPPLRLFPTPPKRLSVKAPPSLALAIALSRTGLFRDASQVVQSVTASVFTAKEALPLAHALQNMSEFGAAYALGTRLLWGQAYTQKVPEAVAILFPKAFEAEVEASCRQNELDPFFAWAIMRRESAFRPEVLSAADARGLMQIIPPTARAIATELGVPPVDEDELFSPDVNIRLGTWYLSGLLSRLGHPALAAGAYNGGPAPVVKWLNKNPELPLDEWIEDIPYRETRGYVKQVLADYFIYQELYGGSAGRLSLQLPTPKETGVNF
jgi:soluble lytic murein transglycosylase